MTKLIRIITLIGLLACLDAMAVGIEIDSVDSELVEDKYLLNSIVSFDFDEEVKEAIDHGVILHFNVVTRIKRKRKWMWDKTVLEKVLNYKLERHALSDNYLVTNTGTNERYQLSSLDEALAILGRITRQELIPAVALIPDRSYTGQIMVQLDIESLPPPLRPVAYTSKEWQLKSDWKTWDIRIVDEE